MNNSEDNTYSGNPDSGKTNQQENAFPQSLEAQEQLSADMLSQRIEEENAPDAAYADKNEITEQPSQGEEDLSGFLERALPDSNPNQKTDIDKPLTKNLLGDNPPGAEQAAFDANNVNDATAEDFKYHADNLKESFRENLDKTGQQINLDKKLRENSDE